MLNRRKFLHGVAGAAALGAAGVELLAAARRLPWAALARNLSGSVVLPGDRGYGEFALPNNLRYSARRPAGIAMCKSARDVSAAISWARENGVPLVARSGGHSYAGYSTTSGLMIDLREMNGVSLDESTGIATVGGGARNGDVYAYFGNRNLAITHGRCAGVGVAGLALGGGIGFNMRAHGLTCDHMVASEIVLADGTIRALSGGDDLLWACRGAGGGNFGINTSFAFQTFDAGKITVCDLIWDEQPERVFAALVEALDRAPRRFGSKVSAKTPTGSSGIEIELLGQLVGTPAELHELLAGAYAIARPKGVVTMDHYWKAQRVLSEAGLPAYYQERSRFFNQAIDHRAVAVVFDWLRRYPKTAKSAEFKVFQTGGRVNDKKPGETAFVHRQSRWLSSIDLYWERDTTNETLKQNLEWQSAFYEAIVPFAKGGAYQNFIDPSLADWKAAYHGANLARLEAIKRRVDPAGVFTFREAIPPA
ncbi:MAG TPA: FAD-binding oxidoreductase [Candidatus Rubrimentiphilum sp.]|nr:FAD-binding oxidoreductase [Candidatus Rubrimentiphilum sp.]